MGEKNTIDPYLMLGHAMAAIWRARLVIRTCSLADISPDTAQLLVTLAGWFEESGVSEITVGFQEAASALAHTARQQVRSLTGAQVPEDYDLLSSEMRLSYSLNCLEEVEASLRAWLIGGFPADEVLIPVNPTPAHSEEVLRLEAGGGENQGTGRATMAATAEQIEAARARIAAIQKLTGDRPMKGSLHGLGSESTAHPGPETDDTMARVRTVSNLYPDLQPEEPWTPESFMAEREKRRGATDV